AGAGATARRAPRFLRPGRHPLQGGDRRGPLHLARLVLPGADARGGFTALTPEEAPRALPTIRARGHEVPREAPGRPLPGCGGAARRSRGGARQTADGVAGALAGVVVRLTPSRGIATGSTTRDARCGTRDAGCGKRDAGCERRDAWPPVAARLPPPAS